MSRRSSPEKRRPGSGSLDHRLAPAAPCCAQGNMMPFMVPSTHPASIDKFPIPSNLLPAQANGGQRLRCREVVALLALQGDGLRLVTEASNSTQTAPWKLVLPHPAELWRHKGRQRARGPAPPTFVVCVPHLVVERAFSYKRPCSVGMGPHFRQKQVRRLSTFHSRQCFASYLDVKPATEANPKPRLRPSN